MNAPPKQQPMRWYVTGFFRYRPVNRLSRGMVTAAPWINVSLLVWMFLFFTSPFVLQPGIVVKLPESPFAAGTRYGHNVVVLSQGSGVRGGPQEIVFFDDQRFLMNPSDSMNELRAAFARATRERPDLPLVIEADQDVRHGTIVKLFNMATDAGITEVNMATRPPATR